MATLKLQMFHRDRITRHLEEMDNFPFTLVMAPMGYGKTMAVQDFLKSKYKDYVWVYANEYSEINEDNYFWSVLINAIKKKKPDIGLSVSEYVFPSDPMQQLRIIDRLKSTGTDHPIYIVIDDFHLIRSRTILNFLIKVVQSQIPYLHIIAIGRKYPSLPLIEWKVKHLCFIVFASTLSFTDEEAMSYLDLVQFNGDPETRNQIVQTSKGWISSIYLMANDFMHYNAVDPQATYSILLRRSLYDSYSDLEKEVLMKLSLLDGFTIDSLSELFSTSEEIEVLNRIYNENALIERDLNGMYHFHDIFRDFLRNEIDITNYDVSEFVSKVAEWRLDHDDVVGAINFWMINRDYDRILQILDTAVISVFLQIDQDALDKIFHSHENDRHMYPIAELKYIFVVCMYDAARGEKLLGQYRSRCVRMEHPTYSKEQLLAESYILQTALEFNNLDRIIAFMDAAAKLLSKRESLLRVRESNLTYGSPHLTYAYYNEPGTYSHIVDDFVNHFNSHIDVSDGCGAGASHVALAEYGLETGRMDEVEFNAQNGLYQARQFDQTCICSCALLTLGRLYCNRHETAKTEDVLKQLQMLSKNVNDPTKLFTVDCGLAYIYSLMERYDDIPVWLREGKFGSGSLDNRLAFNYLIYGKCLLMKEEYEHLQMFSETLLKKFSVFSYQLGYIHAYILAAISSENLRKRDNAVDNLQKAIDIAQQDLIVMPFVEYYDHIASILDDDNVRVMPSAKSKIIDLSKHLQAKPSGSVRIEGQLTSREIDIINCLAGGLSYSEIADELFISTNTVKHHAQNIYQKLGVHNKTQAITKWNEVKDRS